jgi:glycosyltransferase involved in cell wall biosynthesis
LVTAKPLVSFILLAYKQEMYIREAVQSAFAQTYEPLEIILSDDCSSDSTYMIIQEEVNAYQGPHSIILNRNESNLGVTGNLNRALELTRGQFIVASAGDDISMPDRSTELVARLQDKNDSVDMVCSYIEEIDKVGKPSGVIKRDVYILPNMRRPVQQWTCVATGACIGYNRKLYDKYGPLDTRIIAEDQVLSFRAWVGSGIALVEKPLLKYRVHDQSISINHGNIKKEQNAGLRQSKRYSIAGDKVARVEDWLHAWRLSNTSSDKRIEKELKQWIRLLEIEWRAYNSTRLWALKVALQSLAYGKGSLRTMVRLILRNVLRWH